MIVHKFQKIYYLITEIYCVNLAAGLLDFLKSIQMLPMSMCVVADPKRGSVLVRCLFDSRQYYYDDTGLNESIDGRCGGCLNDSTVARNSSAEMRFHLSDLRYSV
jgi:hypothetical protein